MQNVASATSGSAEASNKKSLKERARGELEKYVVITVYLWLLFALCTSSWFKGMESAYGSRVSPS